MPELPDLVNLQKRLNEFLRGQTINTVEVKEPVVVRTLFKGDFAEQIAGERFEGIRLHGPFLIFELSHAKELVIHPMLAGRFQWIALKQRPGKGAALSFSCQPANMQLHYLDDKKMGKVYLLKAGEYDAIPRFNAQGPSLLSEIFTFEYFTGKLSCSRKQVRVLLMDQSVVSAIGNAYADEILFCAGIHPKTLCSQLDESQVKRLYDCVRSVMLAGIVAVEQAAQPLEIKVRDHLQVRNRQNQPCPKCGTKIRRAGVLGHDSYFCPVCQPLQRSQFIDWRNLEKP